MAIITLQVDFLGNPWLSEDVMASVYTLLEFQVPKQSTQFTEADVCIRSAAQDTQQELVIATHNDNLPHDNEIFCGFLNLSRPPAVGSNPAEPHSPAADASHTNFGSLAGTAP